MPFLPYPPTTTSEAIAVFKQDVEILHDIVHGGDDVVVDTESGETPSINNVITFFQNAGEDLLANISQQGNEVINSIGYAYLDPYTFTTGATITASNQALRRVSDGEYFRWAGTLPKVVAPNTNPLSDPLYIAVGNGALAGKIPTVSVEQYGASLVASPEQNAIAIQQALNDNAGIKAVFLPKYYTIDRTILVPSNSIFFGAGKNVSGLRMDSSVARGEPVLITGHRLVRGENIIIRDMKIDFNRDRWSISPSTSSWQALVPALPYSGSNHEVNRSAVMVCNSKNVKLERLKVLDAYKHGIDVSAPWYGDGVGNAITYDTHPSQYVVVEDCEVSGCGDDNITTHQCSYVWINRCVSGESSGAMVAGNSNSFEIDDGSRNVWLTNFVAYKADNGVQIKGHQDRPAPYNVFVNNGIVLNCRNSLEIRHTGWYGSLSDAEDLEPLLDENGNPITVSGSSQTARNVFVDNVMIVAPREWSTGGTMRAAHSCIRIRSYENVALSNVSCIDGDLDLAKTIDNYLPRTPLSSGRIVQINQGASKVRFDNLTIQGFADETSGVRIYGTAGDGISFDGFTVINSAKNGLYQSGTAAVSIDNYTIIGDQMSNNTAGKFETDPNSYGIRTTDNISTMIGAGKIIGYPFPCRFRGVEHTTAINGINMPMYIGRGGVVRTTNAEGFDIERSVEAGTGRMLRLIRAGEKSGYLFATEDNAWFAYDQDNQIGGILGRVTNTEDTRTGLYQWSDTTLSPLGTTRTRDLGSTAQEFNNVYANTNRSRSNITSTNLASTAKATGAATAVNQTIGTSVDAGYAAIVYNNTATSSGTYSFAKARGTESAPLAVQVGDRLGEQWFSGWTGTQFLRGAGILGIARGTINSTNMGGALQFRTQATGSGALSIRWEMDENGHFIPTTDNTLNIGAASTRVKEIFAGNSVINTSDARMKTKIRGFTEDEINAAIELSNEIGFYQWLDSVEEKGDKARQHCGMTVQRAIEIMESYGLDPMSYGFICYDEWDEIPEVLNEETGEVEQVFVQAGNRYSFREGQLNMFIMKGLTAKLNK
jgi:hypothetical protein